MANDKLISASDLILAIRDDPEIDGRAFARVKKHIEDAPAVGLEDNGLPKITEQTKDALMKMGENAHGERKGNGT